MLLHNYSIVYFLIFITFHLPIPPFLRLTLYLLRLILPFKNYTLAEQQLPDFAPVYSSRAAANLKLKKFNLALQVPNIITIITIIIISIIISIITIIIIIVRFCSCIQIDKYPLETVYFH